MKVKVYREIYDGNWCTHLEKFNPTGKWKIQRINDHISLFLQHKGWIFKQWVHENDLIVQEEEVFTNECKK